MGSALARAFDAAGHRVTVWNRSAGKARAFAGRCRLAAHPDEACRSGDLVVARLSSYLATWETLDAPAVREALAGRTLVQLSTGMPAEAGLLGAWANERGAAYLDGKIAVTPGRIGEDLSVIFYAGSRAAFEAWRDTLACLGGRPVFVGEDVGRSSLADFAFLSFYFAGVLGMIYGAAFCRAAGMDLEAYFGAMPSFAAEMIERAPSFRQMIEARDYAAAQSTLKVDLAGARLLAEVADGIGLSPRLPAFLLDALGAGVAAGLGQSDTAALAELFAPRAGSASPTHP